MSEKKVKKSCPMIFNSPLEDFDEVDTQCLESDCAWWSDYHNACAIHTINEIPQKLFSIFQELHL